MRRWLPFPNTPPAHYTCSGSSDQTTARLRRPAICLADFNDRCRLPAWHINPGRGVRRQRHAASNDRCLAWLVGLDGHLAGRVPLPGGLTVVAVARRPS